MLVFDSNIKISLIRYTVSNALLRWFSIQTFKFRLSVIPFQMPCCISFWFKYSNFAYPSYRFKCPAALVFDSNVQISLIRHTVSNALLRWFSIQIFKFRLSVIPFQMPCCVGFRFKYSNFTYPSYRFKYPAALAFDSNIQISLIHHAVSNTLLR